LDASDVDDMRNACYVKIRIALATNNTPADPDEFASFIDGLEARRFDTVWLSDTPMAPVIEPKLALAMASARTTRLKLGTNVVVAGRNPMLLAKELAHLDRLTHGRLLLAFMPGIGSPKERAALGTIGMDRTTRIEQTIELCRAWWAGEPVTAEVGSWSYDAIKVGPPPVQDPLEIWLGGNGPRALQLTGTHADGWLGSRATPAEANSHVATIMAAATEAGRSIDDDHFGISIPYSRVPLDDKQIATLMRKTDADRADILPYGADELAALLQRHIDAGMSKFVLRPMATPDGWDTELDWLAEHAMPFQN
jgi:probable F420-dependent oxidoreductase